MPPFLYWYGQQDLICIFCTPKGQKIEVATSLRPWCQQGSTGALHLDGFKSCAYEIKKERRMPLFLYWYGQQDLNLHGKPLEPKSNVSANSTMPAYVNT